MPAECACRCLSEREAPQSVILKLLQWCDRFDSLVVDFRATEPEVPCPIADVPDFLRSGAPVTGVSHVRIIEEQLERKVASPI
jgi:hypothetical protein